MECSLNMSDHRELTGHKPSLVNAGVYEERQVNISCLCLLWEKELYRFFRETLPLPQTKF